MTDARVIALLDADPDLGRLLDGDALEEARRELVVRQHFVSAGPWDGERLRDAGPEHVGLFMVEGLMARELALADNVSAELLGPGDVLRPWQAEGPERLVPFDVRWNVLQPARLAVLDRRFAAVLARHPEVNAMLMDRLADRAHRLSVMQAISQLNGVDRRLLTLFWHLAERWGRVTREGVAVSAPVPHRIVAQLVGARRPTVSTALSRLAERGELIRRPDGTWLLTGAPVGVPTDEAARIVRRRRRRFEPVTDAPQPWVEGEEGLAATRRIDELHDALTLLREDNARFRAEFRALRGEAADLADRLESQRRREGPAAPRR
jgi:CRP/FNR family transcriptional regulator, cyclic AMP receptor protein